MFFTNFYKFYFRTKFSSFDREMFILSKYYTIKIFISQKFSKKTKPQTLTQTNSKFLNCLGQSLSQLGMDPDRDAIHTNSWPRLRLEPRLEPRPGRYTHSCPRLWPRLRRRLRLRPGRYTRSFTNAVSKKYIKIKILKFKNRY